MSTQNITPCKTFLQKPKNKDFLRKTNTKWVHCHQTWRRKY
jgi:ribosomal protein L32E